MRAPTNAENRCAGFANDPALFAEVSRLVATSDSVDVVLQRILEDAVRVCRAVRGFLAIVDHDRGELDVRYTAGDGWTEAKRIGRLKVSEETGRGITSHVAATARPYRSGNVLEDPYYIRAFDDVRSEMAVPLVDANNRTRGVINVESVEFDAFDEQCECTVAGLADLATIAMTIQDHRARESALVEIGKELNRFTGADEILQKVIDVAAEVLKFEDCSLFLIDVVTDKLVLRASRGPLAKKIGQASYELGEGLTGWTALHGKPVRVVDPRSDPRWKGRYEELPASEVGAYMAVPISIHRGIIGVIRVQRKKSPYKWFPNDFTEDDERVLTTIAAQLGIALDNRRLVDQLVKAERLAAWGEMSARSAHMIGNRVFAIKGDINELEYLLRQEKIEPEKALELMDSIKKGIFLLEEILHEFREFLKATQLELEEADLNELVEEAVEEGFPKRSSTRLNLNLAPDLPKIKADPKKLKRCFSELMENSVNFQPDGGEITITTSLADSRSKRWLKPGQQSGSYVQVRFEDTGPGIDLDKKPKIFNPFYSTRAKGMGLGLSIVKGIVEAHNGAIYENGKPGKGARFTILLPCESKKRSVSRTGSRKKQ
ncbi:MAG: GAF domain-containing protein [Armatimonadota bacterium]